jgi:hypothetical protein
MQGGEDNTTYDELDQNQDQGKECTTIKLLHIDEWFFNQQLRIFLTTLNMTNIIM